MHIFPTLAHASRHETFKTDQIGRHNYRFLCPTLKSFYSILFYFSKATQLKIFQERLVNVKVSLEGNVKRDYQ